MGTTEMSTLYLVGMISLYFTTLETILSATILDASLAYELHNAQMRGATSIPDWNLLVGLHGYDAEKLLRF